jgi:single-strand DNA-binding protein
MGLLWAGCGAAGRRRLSPVTVVAQNARSGGAVSQRRAAGGSVMVNRVVLVGNLGGDPEVRTFGDQQKVTRLSIATHELVTKRSGERERQTEWHQVVAWSALGERAAKHLRKGKTVLVEGRLQTRVWADARGSKHITAEVRAERIVYLGRSNADRGGSEGRTGGVEDQSRSEVRQS